MTIAPNALGIDFDVLAKSTMFDLAQPMKNGMPQSPNHPPFRMILERRHGDMVRSDGGSASNEVIITGGHVGTHVDALGHVSQDGLVYGGIEAAGIQSHLGLSAHAIDTFKPHVGRGVLLDVTKVKGVPTLDPGYGVTADGALVYAGGPALTPGDLVRTLINAGAVRVMQGDINPDWVVANLYTVGDAGTCAGTSGLPGSSDQGGFRSGGWRYLSPDSRDFVAVLAKP